MKIFLTELLQLSNKKSINDKKIFSFLLATFPMRINDLEFLK